MSDYASRRVLSDRRWVVETIDAGEWRVYRSGRKFRRTADAERFADTLRARWPGAEFRVSPAPRAKVAQ